MDKPIPRPDADRRDRLPPEEARANKYTALENGATMGTVCEYQVDDWSWVIITDVPEKTWGDIFDENDDRADENVVRFLNLEKLTDDEFGLFEGCIGCYEHVDTARQFTDHDGAGNLMRLSDFLEKFKPLGPLHPEHRSTPGGDDRGD
ncbi:hypothetical protein [Natronorubrum sp. FCH18a]|uniref:hypothetical protein n=1 Tax=Natronorubrum sp. FCH18a TaxID=3447018 RepID=UPI003F515D1D